MRAYRFAVAMLCLAGLGALLVVAAVVWLVVDTPAAPATLPGSVILV